MNNDLEMIGIIEKEKLSGEFYFQSLFEQGYTKGLCTASDIERLQYECLTFLAQKVELFNAGDSSSIRVEKAQDIMASNLFTVGVWLKTYNNPDDAVTAMLNEQIAELYQKGRQRINTLLSATRLLHAKLLQHLINSPNEFYRSTIEDGINGFFKLYNPDFGAQEIHITADYPLYIATPRLAGIEFIKAYVEAAYYENKLCSFFNANDIHHLLCGYEKNYPELLINIYEQVLLAALGCIIAGTDVYRLDISAGGTAYIYQQLTDTPEPDVFPLLHDTVNELTQCLKCPPGLIRYMQNSLPMLVSRIETAVREQTLERVFVRPC